MKKLIERVRKCAKEHWHFNRHVAYEAADALEQQAKQIEELAAALVVKDEALDLIRLRFCGWHTAAEEALAIRPHASILKAHDQQVISAFLAQEEKWIVNEAILNKIRTAAAEKERQECVQICESKANILYGRNARWQHHTGAATGADSCAEALRTKMLSSRIEKGEA